MSQTSIVIIDVKPPDVDNQNLSLLQRFLSPTELITRYYCFHSNCASLTKPESIEHKVHVQRAIEFEEALIALRSR
jgi:hypothetical protein